MSLPGYLQDPSELGAEHLAAFQGLTRLEIGYQGAQVDAFEAVAQLTRLQRLRLRYAHAPQPPDVRLKQLSTLGRLTSLEGLGEHCAAVISPCSTACPVLVDIWCFQHVTHTAINTCWLISSAHGSCWPDYAHAFGSTCNHADNDPTQKWQ
jgi:hypothetical protein